MKLLLSFVLLISVTTALMEFTTYNITSRLAREKSLERMNLIASIFTSEFERDIYRVIGVVNKVATDPAMARMDRMTLYTYFLSDSVHRVNVDAIYIFNMQRKQLYTNLYMKPELGSRNGISRLPGVSEAVKSEKTVVFPMPGKYGRPGGIFVAAPIMGIDGNPEGFVVAERVIASSMIELAAADASIAGEQVEIFLVDEKGMVIAHTRPEFSAKNVRESDMLLYRSAVERWKKVRENGGGKDFNFKSGGNEYIGVAAAASEFLGWDVVLLQPRDVAFTQVGVVVKRILFIGFLALAVGIGLALYRANRVIKPIGELLMAVEDISRGDYTRRVKIQKRDEIGSLAFAFNQMTSILEEKIQAAKEYQTRLEEAFNQLKSDASKRDEANRELSRKVKELTSLSEVTQTITNSLDLDTVLSTIINAISRVMGFQICSIKLVDQATQVLKIEVSRGLGEEYLKKNATPVGEGISGLAVKMCKPIVIDDVREDPRVDKNHVLLSIGISSIISIPLITKQSVMGVLNLYTKNQHVFTEDEKRLLGIFASQAAAAIENARLFETLRESYLNTIHALSMAIDAKDRYTHGHSKRVKEISVIIGKEMGLVEDQMVLLEYAADLHDIGKIGISELIISKEGKLTVDEYEIIKTHPLVGETIIEPVPFLQDAKPVIRHHHERWDGYGYPDGLSGEEIPLLSRIILIADAYDAMTSDRPYRKALTPEEAVREIEKHKGAQFDPRVVEAFLNSYAKHNGRSEGAAPSW